MPLGYLNLDGDGSLTGWDVFVGPAFFASLVCMAVCIAWWIFSTKSKKRSWNWRELVRGLVPYFQFILLACGVILVISLTMVIVRSPGHTTDEVVSANRPMARETYAWPAFYAGLVSMICYATWRVATRQRKVPGPAPYWLRALLASGVGLLIFSILGFVLPDRPLY